MNIKFLQNTEGDDWDVGDTIRVETTAEENQAFSDTYAKFDPDSITITITGYNSNVVVNSQDMDKNAQGEYYFNWDTTGLSAGDYEVEITATANGTDEVDDEWIRITD